MYSSWQKYFFMSLNILSLSEIFCQSIISEIFCCMSEYTIYVKEHLSHDTIQYHCYKSFLSPFILCSFWVIQWIGQHTFSLKTKNMSTYSLMGWHVSLSLSGFTDSVDFVFPPSFILNIWLSNFLWFDVYIVQ